MLSSTSEPPPISPLTGQEFTTAVRYLHRSLESTEHRMYNRAESALSCHAEGMKKFYTHTSLDLFPCPSCKCSSLITHSFRVFSADSASIKSLSFLYYAPLSPLPVTTAIRFAPLTSPQIYFTSSTAFSKELWLFVIEECLIHFKSTNICLIFWARF